MGNEDIKTVNQTTELEKILRQNQAVWDILDRAPSLHMPNWYLAAGCISQTVWNSLHGFEPIYGIKDYDLVYYDPSDISFEGENVYILKSKELFKDIAAEIEIKNQARVHVWFEQKFGFKIPPYRSVEEAISSWSTTATCLGVRCGQRKFEVYAPYGLGDIFAMTLRPVKRLFSKEMYENKVNRWAIKWPRLKVIPWNSE